MDLQLTNRVVLIVGGTGYLGSAIADRARAEGATVVIASRNSGLVFDAQDQASVDAGIQQILTDHGRLDAVVVTAAPAAGTLDASRLSDPEQVEEQFSKKSMTFLRVANAVLPVMVSAGYGRVVGISGQIAYTTGNITGSIRNAALNIASKNLADQVAGSGVTVNTVNPGNVLDEPSASVEPGRAGQSSPQQIADLVAFLISPLAGAVSGENISVGHKVRGVILP
jgi:NAD(P)-dependent dehydrogenase (short-subunit alcohol dehydrogenase family)